MTGDGNKKCIRRQSKPGIHLTFANHLKNDENNNCKDK